MVTARIGDNPLKWNVGYGHYSLHVGAASYTVVRQLRRGEMMWHAFVHEESEPPQEIPGPLPLNRRDAMGNCEVHAVARILIDEWATP